MIRQMCENAIVSIIVAIIGLGIGFILIDGLASKPESFSGIIIDKNYNAEHSSIGTGYGTSNGKSGVIITSNYESEKFLIIVKTDIGKVITVECKPKLYYQKEIGQKIICIAHKGYFTGWTWSKNGIR